MRHVGGLARLGERVLLDLGGPVAGQTSVAVPIIGSAVQQTPLIVAEYDDPLQRDASFRLVKHEALFTLGAAGGAHALEVDTVAARYRGAAARPVGLVPALALETGHRGAVLLAVLEGGVVLADLVESKLLLLAGTGQTLGVVPHEALRLASVGLHLTAREDDAIQRRVKVVPLLALLAIVAAGDHAMIDRGLPCAGVAISNEVQLEARKASQAGGVEAMC